VSSDNITETVLNELIGFVAEQAARHPNHPALSNMGSSPPAGMLHNITSRSRWTSDVGEIAILRADGNIVGVSCVETCEMHQRLSIGGIRCWLDDRHRTDQLMSKYLLSSNLKWTKEKGLLGMMLTFNHYNKWIYNGISRAAIGKPAGIGTIWSRWWDDCIPLPFPIVVRYTMQWCVIKPLSTGLESIIQEIMDSQ
jgi:hypothetical protein